MSNLNPFDEYEMELLNKSKQEIKAENAAWDALTPEQKAIEKEKSEKRWDDLASGLSDQAIDDDDEDEDEDE